MKNGFGTDAEYRVEASCAGGDAIFLGPFLLHGPMGLPHRWCRRHDIMYFIQQQAPPFSRTSAITVGLGLTDGN